MFMHLATVHNRYLIIALCDTNVRWFYSDVITAMVNRGVKWSKKF